MRFNASSGSTYERCIEDLVRFYVEQGQPWFQRFSEPPALLQRADTPLGEGERTLLGAAIEGAADPDNVALSLKLFGLDKSGRRKG